MKTPSDKTIVFTFGSHPFKAPEMRWTATLTFPAGAVGETVLPIEVTDGVGRPVSDGTFEFAGRLLPVADGRAEITYADFIAGRHSVPLWLHRGGMPPVPGGLTFA